MVLMHFARTDCAWSLCKGPGGGRVDGPARSFLLYQEFHLCRCASLELAAAADVLCTACVRACVCV